MAMLANDSLIELARRARFAGQQLAALSGQERDAGLDAVRQQLEAHRDTVLTANAEDKRQAARDSLDPPLMKRLDLSGAKFDTLLTGVGDICALPDPVGLVSLATQLDEGLELYRVACPIGVICVIFESRPDAAVQIAALALKSANAVILKGGREAYHSNAAIVRCFHAALEKCGLPPDAVQLVSTREEVHELLKLDELIDLVIPRGSKRLVRNIMQSTRIPVMGHADGVCHVYLDRAADPSKAIRVVVDAKTQYTAACNTAETLLVHDSLLDTLLPGIGAALAERGVVFHADDRCLPYLPTASARRATADSFDTEYLSLELSVKAVSSLDEAICHINQHGSHHTDAIVTEDGTAAETFLQRVDSAGVFHNCSTRFADGYRFGFGAEVGVSTNRVHARGPVGLQGLMIYKYRLHGKGHCVSDYAEGRKTFKHRPLAASSDISVPTL